LAQYVRVTQHPALVPELLVESVAASTDFWCGLCGFKVWAEGSISRSACRRSKQAGWPVFLEPEVKRYRIGGREAEVEQFLVTDPDGYLLRFQA
jgi:catechol 2,3-dioxygenase-like lactoylglutathione lyase family enzyme